MSEQLSTMNEQTLRSVWMQPKFVITMMVVIAVTSIVLATVNVIYSNNASQLAKDSFGTRRHGHRALYETLEALQLPVKRRATPLVNELESNDTLVLLQPHNHLVNSDPKFLSDIRSWVESGGRVLVSPQVEVDIFVEPGGVPGTLPKNVLKELGLTGVYAFTSIQPRDTAASLNEMEGQKSEGEESAVRKIANEAVRFLDDEQRTIGTYAVSFRGDLKYLENDIKSISVFNGELRFLYGQVHLATGTVSIVNDDRKANSETESAMLGNVGAVESENENIIAATFRLGRGEIVVLANPCLAENFLLGRSDNAALMAHFLADSRNRVVFDEFYHGRILRGNIFFLLSKLNYATIFCCILLTAAVWSWREGFFLGPGMDPEQPSRRSLREYVNAMARFFLPGRNSYEFLLTELRSGLIFSMVEFLGHPEKRSELDALLGQLERRNPKLGIAVKTKIEEIDRALSGGRKIRKQDVEKILQEFPSCR